MPPSFSSQRSHAADAVLVRPFPIRVAISAALALVPLAGVGVMVVVGLANAVTSFANDLDGVGTIVMGAAAVAALVGMVWAVVTVVQLTRTPVEERPRGRWVAALAIPGALMFSLFGAFVSLLFMEGVFSRGRQLRHRGFPVFAPLHLTREEGWLDRFPTIDKPLAVPADQRDGVAHAWRENGKTEHASVAAFAKLASHLVALGAPARLVEDAHRDALDEIRHGRLCFSLARDIDGRALEPAGLPAADAPSFLRFSRTASLVHLALESLLDGALNEGVSARMAAKLVRRVEDERFRDVLLSIAGDEGRHAAHGWHVLEWCVREGGNGVAAAVRGALAQLPMTMEQPLLAGTEDGRWETFGLPGRTTVEQSYREVRTALVTRAHALLHAQAAVQAAQ